MKNYTPFDKDINELLCEDLEILRQVPEGWYIEYKRDIPDVSAIAKSISAFANTYGGWLFFGIDEESKDNPVAGEFPGVDDLDLVLQRLRNAVAEQMNPSVHFETKVLKGPCSIIGLEENKSIVCVNIPQSFQTPHIHKKGLIYRRVADGSEPRPEADRFVLDQLSRRGDKLREVFKDWYDQDPEFSKQEKNRPYLRLMITPNLWGENNVWINKNIDEVSAIFNQDSGVVAGLPFDTIYHSPTGFIARQIKGNDAFDLGLTWQLGVDLVSDIVIPFNYYTKDQVKDGLFGYKYSEEFMELLSITGNNSLKIIDLKEISKLCKAHNSLFAVDNSLATFISQKPLDLGADFSLFSTTKFISGHGSVIAGAIVAKTKENSEKLHYYSNALGRNQNPLDVHLISLGISSLKVRMKASEKLAKKFAKWL